MLVYSPEFDDKWKEYFNYLPEDIKLRVTNKIRQILNGLHGRHLQHGIDFFIEEVIS